MTSRFQRPKNLTHDHQPIILAWILAAFILGVMTVAVNMTLNYVWVWSCVAVLVTLSTWMISRHARYAHRIMCCGLAICVGFAVGLAEAKNAMTNALRDRLHAPQTVTAIVRVIGLSDGVDENWRQVVERVDTQDGLPKRWLLYPKFAVNAEQRRPVANLRVGEIWQVTAKLLPPHGIASPAAFDQEQWLQTEHIGATGSLESAVLLNPNAGGWRGILDCVDRFRQDLRDHLAQLDSPARAVLLGLLTGDRVLIDPDVRQLYQQAGISHLMAISGPHVVLAALMVAWLVQQLLNLTPLIYLRIPRPMILLPIVMLVVVGYALLAGWGVPAQRTVVMVAMSTVLTLLGRSWSTFMILLMTLAVSLWVDPLAIYQSGLWLSFVATAILVSLIRQPTSVGTPIQRGLQLLKQLIQLQTAMFVLLMPVTLAFFHQISLFSIIVNSIAIPWIGGLVVPLGMMALMVWPIWSGLADALWILAAWMLEQLHWLLQKLPLMVLDHALTPVMFIGLALAVLIWLMPRGSVTRWLIVPCLLPSVLVLMGAKPLFGSRHDAVVRVEVLDVGQGLAVLIQTPHHVMLYDTGAKRADAREGMGERVVLPALSAAHVFHLDRMMLSHADYEHSGGAMAILARMRVDHVISSKSLLNVKTEICSNGQHWQWDGVDFDVLAPWQGRQAFEDKDGSCVLRIRAPAQANGHRATMLLMGDAGGDIESQLLQEHELVGDLLTSDILLLGDHGSDRASSDEFLAAVAPNRVVISTSFLNKKYPSDVVLARLAARHIAMDSTVTSGTLTYTLGGSRGVDVTHYRDGLWWLKRDRE